ncbi:hypothetical protein Si096_01418 [Streptococcus infantarius subsp. infantarius]|nr:hypothetical protein [Streptococcus infantarius subsp. infantarius]MCO4575780.1 hypothetical protein [Streptococcus infantarius subsp. infantarius]
MQELIKENEFLRDELSRVRKECDEYEKLLDEIRIF